MLGVHEAQSRDLVPSTKPEVFPKHYQIQPVNKNKNYTKIWQVSFHEHLEASRGSMRTNSKREYHLQECETDNYTLIYTNVFHTFISQNKCQQPSVHQQITNEQNVIILWNIMQFKKKFKGHFDVCYSMDITVWTLC